MRRPGCPQRMATLHGFGRSGGFGCTEHRARTSVGEGEMALIDRYRRGSERTAFGRSSLSLAIAGIIAGLGSAQAQEPIQPVMEEVTVTGTRTRQVTGFTTPVPVTSLSTEELFSYEPGSTIAAQLDALPQFFGNESIQQQTLTNIASSGTASLDLRNLGPNRTLVLFDGYRIVPSSKFGSVNVDAFPTALIRSVEVVTGGDSVAYGADAVGGVVNFIIAREFEGVDLRATTGANDFGDGENWNFSLAGGEGFFNDKLHVVASFEAQEIKGFTRTAREVPGMKRWGWVTNPEWSPGAPPGVPQRLTLPWVASTVVSPTGLILNTGTELDMMRFTMDGSDVVPFELGSISSTGGPGSTQSTSGGADAMLSNDAFDGGIMAADVSNRSGFVGLQYSLTDRMSVFGQIMYGRTEAEMVQD